MNLAEPLDELFTRSSIIVLDFSKILKNVPDDENIENYFATMAQKGDNPRLPQNRQAFNDHVLKKTGARYLVGQYGEDRVAMLADTPAGKEGRTIHMALDIFAADREVVLAPCDGTIVRSGYESGFGEYGNYVIIQPKEQSIYIFLGHLGLDRHAPGEIRQGQIIGSLGDYSNSENGGWSRHLHFQILRELPPLEKTPDGYSTQEQFILNAERFPNPLHYFPEWKLQQSPQSLSNTDMASHDKNSATIYT